MNLIRRQFDDKTLPRLQLRAQSLKDDLRRFSIHLEDNGDYEPDVVYAAGRVAEAYEALASVRAKWEMNCRI